MSQRKGEEGGGVGLGAKFIIFYYFDSLRLSRVNPEPCLILYDTYSFSRHTRQGKIFTR